MDNYITILPSTCINFNHKVQTFCLPEKTLCDNSVVDGLLVECGGQWNCNKLCGLDKDYFVILPQDAAVMIQTNFNTPKNPTSGWGDAITIKMYNTAGVLISDVHTAFASRYMVGHTGKYGFQNIEISGALVAGLGVSCFYFEIQFGDTTICTQHFKLEDCISSVSLESTYSEYDCWNNYYKPSSFGFVGSGNFAYSNKVYLNGKYKYFGSNVTDDGIVENIRFYPSELIAPFMERYISHKLLKAKQVIIEGEYYDNKANVLTPRERSSMFFPILEFEKTACNSSNKCS